MPNTALEANLRAIGDGVRLEQLCSLAGERVLRLHSFSPGNSRRDEYDGPLAGSASRSTI